MKFWLFILLLGVCLTHWTTARLDYKGYSIEDDTLVDVQNTSTHIILASQGFFRISNSAFNRLGAVTSLDLSYNSIKSLAPSIFSRMPNLERLSLKANKIASLDNVFHGLNNLTHVDMSSNPVSYLKKSYFSGLPKSAIIYFGRDQPTDEREYRRAHYDRHDLEYSPPLNYHLPPSSNTNVEIKICKTADGLVKSVEELRGNDTLGDCIERKVINGLLDLSDLRLRKFERNWYKLQSHDIKALKLYRNEITDITPELLNDLPSSLSYVDLSSNNIKMIKKNSTDNRYIEVMQLNDNLISTVEDGAFENTNLSTLNIRANHLNDLTFVKTLPPTMRRLSLSQNAFVVLAANAFQGLEGLQELTLDDSRIETIEPGAFEDLENLVKISMTYNRFNELKSGAFRGLKDLETVDLSSSRIEKIFQGAFSGISSHLNISFLDLAKNKITDIARNAFEGSTVKDLRLNENSIKQIDESFPDISGIEYLNLKRNHITNIKKGAFKHAPNLKKFDLRENPLKRIENSAFHGLSFEDVDIAIPEVSFQVEAGAFADM